MTIYQIKIRWLHSHRVLVAWLVVAMLMVGLLTILVIRQQQNQASQVYLEAGGSVGVNPFVQLPDLPATVGGNLAGEGASLPVTAGQDARATYDPEKLISYLGTHPQAAAAWVQALNSDPTLSWSGGNRVEVQQIPAYIHELTPRNLTEDLRVTDHQFANGGAIAVQSILERGTIVLVDARGVSRVRCVSGNPLTPMTQLKAPPTYRGTRWPGFQPQRVVVIPPHPARQPERAGVPDPARQPERAGVPDPARQPERAGVPDPARQPERAGVPDPARQPERAGVPDPARQPERGRPSDDSGRSDGSEQPDESGETTS
jgi:hypothetical protein